MRRAGLGALFLIWLYGVPFLLIVGLVRRTSAPYVATHAAARSFGATTDTILTTALLLNLALPVAGWLLARWARDRLWLAHFGWSFAGLVLVYLAVAVVGGLGTAPLFGWTPADHEPTPQPTVTRCIPRSGGHGCPGG
ncbi:hypothetical protein [Dactylosporangium matsuzakiense]|uniref:Uncharacterized protein n=1 Tax=Dactylosporangium matsuzakiense TaxID=53360 RepID=A0A9W6NJ43_9ACTN|nr:hypothetical protein [Dactylosporangium matsuzakiense]UWZ47260.1 hypothetical protein Dmats_13140 [Dactylosporangium matsuzakiense]GLK98286.1 hypothetical protein GCM10017581_000270 [Dactylosporangium matsuzakiense]